MAACVTKALNNKKKKNKSKGKLTIISLISLIVSVLLYSKWQQYLEDSGKLARGCDLYRGTWVRDEEGRYPLYHPRSCPFVDNKFACQENGRRDEEYLRWRWKPQGCDLPRFNATDLLERLRDKVLMLVGDSMSRNQFESLLCLLHEVLHDKGKMGGNRGYKISRNDIYYKMHIEEYNCSVEYYRSYYLVRQGIYLDENGENRPKLHVDRIDELASMWKAADILIFNTGPWWTGPKTNSGKYFYQEGDTIYPMLNVVKAYKKGLQTWARWIQKNLIPQRTIVFFCGAGTQHFTGGGWDSGGACDKEIEPTFEDSILNEYPWRTKVAEEVIGKMRFPIILLNVTRMTSFRKDAHPSIYGHVSSYPGLNSSKMQDCSHWCLPGVPDVWNELVYTNLVFHK